tara:strand:+ start:644 stop:1015 length:372 start_codon:yes stop_codon:yes gene_type:complete
MSKKVKGEVFESKKVKGEIQVVKSEIHLLIYKVSETEERILSSYNYKEDILFLINEFSKSQKLRTEYDIENVENLKMISISLENNYGIEIPSLQIRKKELDRLFSDLDKSISEMEQSQPEKIN